jgi:hypothetical protein
MDLQCLIPHYVGQTISVDGRKYKVDGDAFLRGVPDADAKALLQNRTCWALARTPVGAAPAEKPQGKIVVPTIEEVEKAGYAPSAARAIVAKQQALADGKSIKEADDLAQAAMDAYLKAEADRIAEEAKAAGAGGGKGTGTPETAPKAAVYPAIPVEGEEWPDPTEEMELEYLHKMALAYEVKAPANIGKAKLIEKIKAVMYEEEGEGGAE